MIHARRRNQQQAGGERHGDQTFVGKGFVPTAMDQMIHNPSPDGLAYGEDEEGQRRVETGFQDR